MAASSGHSRRIGLLINQTQMLKEIYITFGGVGAFFVSIALCLTALTWLLALTGTVTRNMVQWKKASLLFLLSIAPPASIGVLIAFLINDRRLATVAATSRAKRIG